MGQTENQSASEQFRKSVGLPALPYQSDGDPGVATREDGALARFARTASKLGPISTDFTSVNIGVAGDAVTYNQQYPAAVGAVLQAAYLGAVDLGEGLHIGVSGAHFAYGPQNTMPHTIRTMCDADKFCWATNFGANLGMMVYVDGRPTSLTPYTILGTIQFHTIIFPTAKPRLIEIRTAAGVSAVYTQKPYQCWKPAPRRGHRVLVIGDSYAAGQGATLAIDGIYHNIGPHIGSEDVWLDAVGSTGIGVTAAANGVDAPANRYLDRLDKVSPTGEQWDIATIKPDVVVVHGGGANDLFKGRTAAQVIEDAASLFTALRAARPEAKLVFVEGFAPPTTFSGYNPNYIAIREGVQAALNEIGVYYIDVATTAPWIAGTGKVGATTGVGNSDVYVGADGVHMVTAGHLYVRGRMAQKLQRVLSDHEDLLNQLV